MVNDKLRLAVLKRRELLVGAAAVALVRFEGSAMAQPEERKVDIEGLAASYMRPTSEERAPTAIIIAGSGPTDRDGNSTLGLKTDTYKLLAHALAERGVASVRNDKRGVAGSTVSAFRSSSSRSGRLPMMPWRWPGGQTGRRRACPWSCC
jgi:hypothetical protein